MTGVTGRFQCALFHKLSRNSEAKPFSDYFFRQKSKILRVLSC